MNAATTANRKADRTESRLLRSLLGRVERYMGRAGLIAFMADPTAAPAPADPSAAPAADPSAAPAPAPTAAPAATPAPSPAPAAAPKADDKPTGAPEAYEAFTVPEGVKLDDAVMGKFQTLAKELNLPQDAAQKLVELGVEMQSGSATALQAAIDAQGDAWASEAKADKEFGGDKFDENLAIAKTALDKFGTPEFSKWLVDSKLGNHPEMLRTFYRIGQAISQDGFVPGRAGQNATAQSMYANSNMNP